MSMQLKILDQRHKQKLNLKALDAVLFGPPLRESATRSPSAKLGCFFYPHSQHLSVLSRSVVLLQVHNITG